MRIESVAKSYFFSLPTGIDSVDINYSKDLVTIKGSWEAEDLISHLQTRLKTFSFKVVSTEKEKTVAKKVVCDKSNNEAKKDEDGNEPSKKMEDHKMEPMSPLSPIPHWRYNDGNYYDGGYHQMEPYGYRDGYPYEGYVHGSQYPNYGYAMEPRAPPPSAHHMFSDENPNACSIM